MGGEKKGVLPTLRHCPSDVTDVGWEVEKRCLADFTPLSVGCNGCNGSGERQGACTGGMPGRPMGAGRLPARREVPPAGGTSRLAGRRPAPIGLPGMPPVHAPWRSPEPLHPLHPTDSGVKSARHLFSTSHPTSVTSDGQWRKVGKTPFFSPPTCGQ